MMRGGNAGLFGGDVPEEGHVMLFGVVGDVRHEVIVIGDGAGDAGGDAGCIGR